MGLPYAATRSRFRSKFPMSTLTTLNSRASSSAVLPLSMARSRARQSSHQFAPKMRKTGMRLSFAAASACRTAALASADSSYGSGAATANAASRAPRRRRCFRMTGSYECPTEGSAGFRPALNEALSALLSIRLSLQAAGGKVANEEGAVRCQQVSAQAIRQIRLHRVRVRTTRAGAHRAVGDGGVGWHRHLLQLDRQVVPLDERQRRFLRCRGRGARGAEANSEECN